MGFQKLPSYSKQTASLKINLAQNFKHRCQITPTKREDAQGNDLTPIFGDLSQIENFSQIKPSLLVPEKKRPVTKAYYRMPSLKFKSWTESSILVQISLAHVAKINFRCIFCAKRTQFDGYQRCDQARHKAWLNQLGVNDIYIKVHIF